MTMRSREEDYEIVTLKGGGWGVSFSAAGVIPHVETGFASRAEAEAWMFQQMERPNGSQGLPPYI